MVPLLSTAYATSMTEIGMGTLLGRHGPIVLGDSRTIDPEGRDTFVALFVHPSMLHASEAQDYSKPVAIRAQFVPGAAILYSIK